MLLAPAFAADKPLSLQVYATRGQKLLGFGEMVDRLLQYDIICIGETHDSEPVHRVQLQIIKALYAQDERLGVGMEMFQRPFQKEIDRYFRDEIKEDEFLKATEYKARWGFDWSLYRPIVEFCRRNELPIAALNVPRELTRRLSKVGFCELTEDERKQLGTIDFQVPAHRDHWYELLPTLHGQKDASPEQKEKGYQVMAAWDEYMADSAALFQKERRLRRLVVLAGSGHIERGFGIPDRTVKRTGGKAATIRVAVGGDVEKLTKEETTDYVIVVR